MADTQQSQFDRPIGNAKGQVKAPQNKAVAINTAETIYDYNIDGPLDEIDIQNVGTGVLLVAINDTATLLIYNRALAVDTGAKAGAGGTWKISGRGDIRKISVFAVANSHVAWYQVTNNLNQRS